MTRLGVITGLERESACLNVFPADQRPAMRCAGAKSARAHALALELAEEGCQGLLSFGTAGGLTAEQPPGRVIIASSVTAPDGRVFETSKAWLNRVQKIIGFDDGITIAGMAGAALVVATPQTKKELGLATNAVAVDMESHAVAAVAEEVGVPFMIIRAVADPVDRSIPEWVLGKISDHGAPRYGAILAGLAVHPWDLPALIRLKLDSDRALHSLRGVAGRLGPLFGLG